MGTRSPELEGKTFRDEDNILYEGQRFIDIVDHAYPSGFFSIEVHYLNGKIHGKPAIIYPDGLEETWENGKFIEVNEFSYSERE